MATIYCDPVTFLNIEAIIFDKDGTLADSTEFLRTLGQKRSHLIDAQIPGIQDALLMAFGFTHNHLNPNGLLAIGTRYENEIAAAAYVAETGRDWMQALTIVQLAFLEADRFMPSKATQTPLIPGALPLLQTLKAANLKLGILSSDTTKNVKDFVQTYQLDSYFSVQMGIDVGKGKPDPALLEHACSLLNTSPATTLIVGDSQADMQLARLGKAAGCIAVTWAWTNSSQSMEADVMINRFEQIQVKAID